MLPSALPVEPAMRGLIFRLLGATWLAFLVAPAGSADIKINEHRLHDIILEGTIVSGDYDKLRKLIDEHCPAKSWSGKCTLYSIFLASPGGSLTEAMKIGRLVRALRWDTEIPSDLPPDLLQKTVAFFMLKDARNWMCTSACFFIWIAGIERWHGPPSTKGLLGIHRPYISDAELKTLSANQAMASATQVRTIIEAYLKEMGVPSKYADLMFSIPKNEVRWIRACTHRSGHEPAGKADWIGRK
jgi:hypothetical protein